MMIKRILLFTLALCLLLASCKPQAQPQTQPSAGDTVFSEPTTIKMAIGSHASWPYNENWIIWDYIREATGAEVSIQAIPNEELNTKVTLMLASPDTLPDLIHMMNKPLVDQHAESGAFVSMTENLDQLPNFTTFLDSLPQVEREEMMAQRTAADGEVYFTPISGTETVNNLRTWMYRKDIFEKHSLAVPETMEQVYQAAKALKQSYPDSYPLAFRTGLEQLDVMGPQWQNDFCRGVYYDFQAEEWKFGGAQEVMRQMIEYFLKMKNEGLVPPDYLTITPKAWEALVTTDRGFMMPEYIVRIDFFNLPAREQNPDYTWAAMAPPRADVPTGQAKLAKLNFPNEGFVICNTKDQKRIKNALRFIDWMYSDSGSELLNWGKEGETYQMMNGEKQFILTGDEDPRQKYGFGTYGVYTRVDPAANEAIYTKEQVEQGRIAVTYTEDHINPIHWLTLNDGESAVRDQYLEALEGFNDEQLSKFLLGQRPLSEWDAFQAELEEVGLSKILKIYQSAYERITNMK